MNRPYLPNKEMEILSVLLEHFPMATSGRPDMALVLTVTELMRSKETAKSTVLPKPGLQKTRVTLDTGLEAFAGCPGFQLSVWT